MSICFVHFPKGSARGEKAHLELLRGLLLLEEVQVLRELRHQGLDELALLVTPTAGGGDGVTYLNWGVMFYAYQPFDSDLASHHLQLN